MMLLATGEAVEQMGCAMDAVRRLFAQGNPSSTWNSSLYMPQGKLNSTSELRVEPNAVPYAVS